MKKRLVILALVAGVFAVSAISAKPLVSGQWSDINSCQVIYHDGSHDFTYGDAGQNEGVAGTNKYGSTKTLKNYKGYELCCQVILDHKHMATVSLPVDLSDFSTDVQAQLNQLQTVDVAMLEKAAAAAAATKARSISLTNANQINGSLGIARDELALYRK